MKYLLWMKLYLHETPALRGLAKEQGSKLSTIIQRYDNDGSYNGDDNGSGDGDAPNQIRTHDGSRSTDWGYTYDHPRSHGGTSHQSEDYGVRRFGCDDMVEPSDVDGVHTSYHSYNPSVLW